MTKVQMEMAREDWLSLMGFLQTANDVRALMVKTTKAGKQQVPITAIEVERWLDTEVPAAVWVKLGAVMAKTEKQRVGERDE